MKRVKIIGWVSLVVDVAVCRPFRGIHREYARLQGHVRASVKTKKKAKKGESLNRNSGVWRF